MRKTWKPTLAGKIFTSAGTWTLTLDASEYVLTLDDSSEEGSVMALELVGAAPGIVWTTLSLRLRTGRTVTLNGIPNAAAQELTAALAGAHHEIELERRAGRRELDLTASALPVVEWAKSATKACFAQLKTRGWLTHEFKQKLNRTKPNEFCPGYSQGEVAEYLSRQPEAERKAFKFWGSSFDTVADAVNESHLVRALRDSKDFFDAVEKSALTPEQTRAVVCFDNRVLLVASAGSGKTSTMVAKAGYALKMGYFPAERILLLAFNSDAADELGARVRERLIPLGLPAEKIVAKTFHAFGLDVIGAATGMRPSVAPWVENGKDLEAILQIVDELKDSSPSFRTNWDLFRLVFAQDLPKFGEERQSGKEDDTGTDEGGFRTLNNDVVKSRGEQLIANWLFYNGVKYFYERAYKHPTADAKHQQYEPDFYFPDIDTYLEHWGLDKHGEPPVDFVGYKDDMAWKKDLHLTCGTRLLETTMADLWSGKAFAYLSAQLTANGLTLDPNPDRPAPGRRPIENPRLARTFRSFLTHAKSNRFSAKQLRQRLDAGAAGHFQYRHSMFLSLFEEIRIGWDSKLRAAGCVDFEDMLSLAADYIEQSKWISPYELVMVDEFQDASQARARLISALVKAPGTCLFAVGDDWQSINRYAGADLAVMTQFEAKFGRAVHLKLERTFRCPQSLCDISSTFVQKNPNQLRKRVLAAAPDIVNPVTLVAVNDVKLIGDAVSKRIEQIAAQNTGGLKIVRVYILGRYKKEKIYVPAHYDKMRVEVSFITVHKSKGLEADHIIVPRMTYEVMGFPSQVDDDPVLQLAMPESDAFPHSEERRLFYVALTRAKLGVTLITVARNESIFIKELVEDHKLDLQNADGSPKNDIVCPACRLGLLVKKNGSHGEFYGCNQYPKCKKTQKVRMVTTTLPTALVTKKPSVRLHGPRKVRAVFGKRKGY